MHSPDCLYRVYQRVPLFGYTRGYRYGPLSNGTGASAFVSRCRATLVQLACVASPTVLDAWQPEGVRLAVPCNTQVLLGLSLPTLLAYILDVSYNLSVFVVEYTDRFCGHQMGNNQSMRVLRVMKRGSWPRCL
jgi:hypothetical protein